MSAGLNCFSRPPSAGSRLRFRMRAEGVLEYEYEFLFDAGAMGRFEGLVPQAVPDTVTVQSGNPAPARL